MNAIDFRRMMAGVVTELLREPVTENADEFAEKELHFNEPKRVGKFSFFQREYLREPLRCYSDDDIADVVLCFGTRTGKTTVMYAGTCFRIKQQARRVLYVKPGAKGTAALRVMPGPGLFRCCGPRLACVKYNFIVKCEIYRSS